MTSVALTNKPSQMGRIEPIINNSPNEEKIIMEMTREELVSLIKDTITSMDSCPEKKDETTVNSCTDDEDKMDEVAVNEETSITEPETKEEPVVKTVVDKQVVEDTKETKPVAIVIEETKVEEKKEVIKEEALNSVPTIGSDVSGKAEWMNLRGKEFFTYLKNHPEIR